MKSKSVFCIVLLSFKFASLFALDVKIDASELVSNSAIYVTEDGPLVRISQSGSAVLAVEQLPTIIKLVSLERRKIITRQLVWLTSDHLKLKGSIEGNDFTLFPEDSGEILSVDEVDKWSAFLKKAETELLDYEPFLVYLRNNLAYLDIEITKKISTQISSDKNEFWAVRDIRAFLENHDDLGFDSVSGNFNYLTAINKVGQKQIYDRPAHKFLLIDFSNSGCRPCLEDISELALLYKEYSQKLEIWSIWNDPSQNTWLNTAKKQKDEITWVNMRDGDGAIFKKFDVDVYPTYFLLDDTGTVIRRWNGSGVEKVKKYLN